MLSVPLFLSQKNQFARNSLREDLKGIYVNINSPIELYKNGVGYYDLEVDVVLTRNGNVKVLDRKGC
ncbi:MAG: DUF402 domain-containing protein [Candidatus Korarchaeota archaeon]|nr:DUF402 domain-containing protein [Candidatus Korarchaeota archaeon]NIU83097.1 DUF402 domain-containing protein [Candidatus Thorarchaeota archaeon]NIW13475.1 DUF402 domain-containing protein [Candidatus Thorarchaeota archaeon]